MQNKVGFEVFDHSSNSYALALGINKEKANLLLEGVKEISHNELSVTEKFEYTAALCDNVNELAFCMFKLGEISGASKMAKRLAEDL